MSTEPEKRLIQIVNRKTGEVRLSEPVQVQLPNQPVVDAGSPAAAPMQVQAPGRASEPAIESAPTSLAPAPSTTEKPAKAPKSAKPKLEIETFEQFIEYAYKRRGQPAKLESRVRDAIAKQPGLDEAAKGRLLPLVNGDTLLAVPRQILLASKEVTGLPALRGALEEMVKMVMLRHPAFASERVKAALQNLPGTLPAEALVMVAGYTPAEVEGSEPLKPAELKDLRRNATHLLATWFALHRGVGLEDMSNLLFHALWEPAARELEDDTERLRALTDIEDLAGAGVAAQRYRQQLADARHDREQALRDTVTLAQQVAELKAERDTAQTQLCERNMELDTLRASSQQEVAQLREEHRTGRMHQGHEYESLRGRMVQRLEEAVETLEVGLSALRNSTPRVSVMDQRAEVVLDALRAELNNLREE